MHMERARVPRCLVAPSRSLRAPRAEPVPVFAGVGQGRGTMLSACFLVRIPRSRLASRMARRSRRLARHQARPRHRAAARSRGGDERVVRPDTMKAAGQRERRRAARRPRGGDRARGDAARAQRGGERRFVAGDHEYSVLQENGGRTRRREQGRRLDRWSDRRQVGAASQGRRRSAATSSRTTSSKKVGRGESARSADRAQGRRRSLLLGAPRLRHATTQRGQQDTGVGEVRLAVDIGQLAAPAKRRPKDGERPRQGGPQAAVAVRRHAPRGRLLLGASRRCGSPRRSRAVGAGAPHRRRRLRPARRGQRGDEVGELGDELQLDGREPRPLVVDEVSRKAGSSARSRSRAVIQGLMTPPATDDARRVQADRPLRDGVARAAATGGATGTLTDGRLLVVVGDVTGHGMPSAMIAATGRGAVEALAIVDHARCSPKLGAPGDRPRDPRRRRHAAS